MLLEISLDSFWSQFIAITVLLAPIVLPLIRYILHLGSVQAWIKQQKHGEIILTLAGLAIDKVEAFATSAKKSGNTEAITSTQKLEMAIDFMKKQGLSMQLPKNMLADDMIKAAIESKLAEKSAAS